MQLLTALRWFAVLLAIAIVGVQAALWLRPAPPIVIETGTAVVGAPFTLSDHTGKTVSDVDFRGRYVVLTFGWTRDPDITPALLQLLVAALDGLGPKNKAITPVFVTVDPGRDGPEDIKATSERYGPKLIALRGSNEMTTALTRAYRLPVTRVQDTMLPGGYSLDHPAVYYVLGKDGGFRGVVPFTTDVKALTGDLRKLTE
jgi:protein SCO1